MKNSITKFTIAIAIFGFNAVDASSNDSASPQVVKTIIIDGKIYSLINLPAVEVNASGIVKPVSFNKEDINLVAANSSKMVKVEKHNRVFMPSVLLAEANVVAFRNDANKHVSLKGIFSSVFGFVYSYVAHFGVIH